MGRRHRRRPAAREPGVPGVVGGRVEAGPDGADFQVRAVPAHRAVKAYRCPGCDHPVAVGVAHVVAWPVDESVEDRRHWHSACWQGRATRRPTRRWS